MEIETMVDRQRTVTIGVSSLEETMSRAKSAFKGKYQGRRLSFISVDLMWKILTPKRWEIIRAMTGAGPLSIREVARRVKRDVKAVHGDITALIKAGIINKTDEGKVEFPYDRVHVDFEIKAA
jgi:predicted transcriptional regulator